MKYLVSTLFLFMLLGFMGISHDLRAQTIYYVDASQNTDPSDGLAWATAFDSLQQAIDVAMDGDTIWVAEGTYFPTAFNTRSGLMSVDPNRSKSFILKSGVKIFGGFTNTATEFMDRDPSTNQTILSGDLGTINNDIDNAYHVIYINYDLSAESELDGFTIEKGNANLTTGDSFGGGIVMSIVDFSQDPPVFLQVEVFLILRNILFRENNAREGGAIRVIANSESIISPILEHCVFENNTAFNGGSCYANLATSTVGVLPSVASPTFINCLFKSNTSTNGEGAIDLFIQGDGITNADFKNCIFYDNDAGSGAGGAVQIEVGEAQREDAIFDFENCTFLDNTARTFNSTFWMTGLRNSDPLVILDNCIFANTSCDQFPIAGSAGTFRFSHTLIDTTFDKMMMANVANTTIDTSASGMIFDQESELVDPANCNFGLMITSPALNTGVDDSVTTVTDFAGDPRIQNGRVDMGALEFQGFIATPVAKCKNIQVSLDENGCVSITPEQVDDGSERAESLSLDRMDFKCDDLGENMVTLTATNELGFSTCNTIVTVTAGMAMLSDITGKDTMVCLGDEVDLATLVGGTIVGTLSFGSVFGTYDGNQQVNPFSDTTFFVRDSSEMTQCVDTAQITIMVNPQPDITGRDTTICMGASVDLSTLLAGTIVNDPLEYGTSRTNFNEMMVVVPEMMTTYVVRDSSTTTMCSDTAQITVHVLTDMECLMSFSSENEIDFGDPCLCDQVVRVDERTFFFRDTLTIDAEAGQTILFSVDGAMDFYSAPEVEMADETPFIETSPGIYQLEFFKLSGAQASGSVTLIGGDPFPIPIDALEFCFVNTDCPFIIPTMGQWGMISLAIILWILGIQVIRRREIVNSQILIKNPAQNDK